ncbi:conjugative transfer protein trbI [Vibrio ishigakensis]|uniref:Conjugative transfer protein trbI n=1 Tax=Vibrio ishigakensis TaxID=1481914 RepID=A0A0B8PS74_9VIBR|nr:conjugative transfer protein trbI [Vibrio ishigakensis]
MGEWGMILLIIVMVIITKGQKTSTAKEAPNDIQGTAMQTAATLDEVLKNKPQTPSVISEVAPPDKGDTATPPEAVARIKALAARQQANADARHAQLSQAIHSTMSIEFDETTLIPEPSKNGATSTLTTEGIPAQEPSVLQPDPSWPASVADQARKQAFLDTPNKAGYLDAQRERPMSDYELTVGTVIPATLISAINSDIPGNLIAQVSQNVYDSATGDAILIPQGTRLYGTYDSQVVYGQRRLPVTWSRVNFPDGTKLNLGNMASLDVTGMNGLTGEVNHHFWRLFAQATLLGGIAGLSQVGLDDGDDDSDSVGESVADGVTQQYAQTGNELIRKNMDVQPTIEVDNATEFYIMVSQDIALMPYTPIR